MSGRPLSTSEGGEEEESDAGREQRLWGGSAHYTHARAVRGSGPEPHVGRRDGRQEGPFYPRAALKHSPIHAQSSVITRARFRTGLRRQRSTHKCCGRCGTCLWHFGPGISGHRHELKTEECL